MHLQFINNSTLGPKERRVIRSHVMQGKNAGRTRPPKKKPTALAPIKRRLDRFESPECVNEDSWRMVHSYKRTLGLRQLLWDDLSLVSFPEGLTGQSRKLLHQSKQVSNPS